MVILGIDPGLAIVGWGLIESNRGQFRPLAYGAITTPAHTPIESRLSIIREDLKALIEKYKPDEMAVEELFFTNGIHSALVTTILDHIVVKKDSTKEKLHLDIHLKFGAPCGVVFDRSNSAVCFDRPRSVNTKDKSGHDKRKTYI